MQQIYLFKKLFNHSIPLLLMLLSGCFSGKSSSCENTGVGNNADRSNKREILWTNTTIGSGEESHGHFLLQCSDSGFLQIGKTGSLPINARIFVVKVAPDVAPQGEKEYLSAGHNLGNGTIEVDDGYIVFGAMNGDSLLIKLSKKTGDILFSKSYNFGGFDAIESMILLESNLIPVGYIGAQDSDTTFYTEGEGYLMTI